MFKFDHINAAKFSQYAILFGSLLFPCYSLGMDGPTQASFYYHPKSNPYLAYVVLGRATMHFKAYKEKSELVVLQSTRYDQEYFDSVFKKLIQKLKKDKELKSENALTVEMTGSFYVTTGPKQALTYIHDQEKVWAIVVEGGDSASGPLDPENDIIGYPCLSAGNLYVQHSMMAELIKEYSALKLDEIAPKVARRLTNSEGSYIIIDLKKLKDDVPSDFTQELSI